MVQPIPLDGLGETKLQAFAECAMPEKCRNFKCLGPPSGLDRMAGAAARFGAGYWIIISILVDLPTAMGINAF